MLVGIVILVGFALVYVFNPTSALTALRDNGLEEIRLEEAEVKKDYVSASLTKWLLWRLV